MFQQTQTETDPHHKARLTRYSWYVSMKPKLRPTDRHHKVRAVTAELCSGASELGARRLTHLQCRTLAHRRHKKGAPPLSGVASIPLTSWDQKSWAAPHEI